MWSRCDAKAGAARESEQPERDVESAVLKDRRWEIASSQNPLHLEVVQELRSGARRRSDKFHGKSPSGEERRQGGWRCKSCLSKTFCELKALGPGSIFF